MQTPRKKPEPMYYVFNVSRSAIIQFFFCVIGAVPFFALLITAAVREHAGDPNYYQWSVGAWAYLALVTVLTQVFIWVKDEFF